MDQEHDVNALYDAYEADGMVPRFWTPFEQYRDRIGQPYRLLRRATQDEIDDECAPMWLIRFPDGFKTLAHPEEIAAITLTIRAYTAKIAKTCIPTVEMIFPRYLVETMYRDSVPGKKNAADFESWVNFYTPDSNIGLGIYSYAESEGYYARQDDMLIRPMLSDRAVCFDVKGCDLVVETNPDSEYSFEQFLYWQDVSLLENNDIAMVRPAYRHLDSGLTIDVRNFNVLEYIGYGDTMDCLPNPAKHCANSCAMSGGDDFSLRSCPEKTMVPVGSVVKRSYCGELSDFTHDGQDVHLEFRVDPQAKELVAGVTLDGVWYQNLLLVRGVNRIGAAPLWELYLFDEHRRAWVLTRTV